MVHGRFKKGSGFTCEKRKILKPTLELLGNGYSFTKSAYTTIGRPQVKINLSENSLTEFS